MMGRNVNNENKIATSISGFKIESNISDSDNTSVNETKTENINKKTNEFTIIQISSLFLMSFNFCLDETD